MKNQYLILTICCILSCKYLICQTRPDRLAFKDSTSKVVIPKTLESIIKLEVSFAILQYRMFLNPKRVSLNPNKVMNFYLPDTTKFLNYYALDLEVQPWKVGRFEHLHYYRLRKKSDLLINLYTGDTLNVDVFNEFFSADSVFLVFHINPSKSLHNFAFLSGGFFLSDFNSNWYKDYEDGDNSISAREAIFLRLAQFSASYKVVSLNGVDEQGKELHTEKYYNYIVDSFPLAPKGGHVLARVQRGIGPKWDNIEVVYYTNDPPGIHLPLEKYEVKFIYKNRPRYNDLKPEITLMDDEFYQKNKAEPWSKAFHLNRPKRLREEAFCDKFYQEHLNPLLRVFGCKIVPSWRY